MMKRILITPNAFKNSLSSLEVALVIESAIRSLKMSTTCQVAPIADGGDGTADVFKYYFKTSKFISSRVHDPLMRKIQSKWLLLNKNIAVIELAKASGIALLKKSELNPYITNTVGTGELIKAALNYGCRKIIITLGGSATTDAGLGILTVLGGRLYDKKGNLIFPCGRNLSKVCEVDLRLLDKRFLQCDIEVLCDVQNVLYGRHGTMSFSSQKGASKFMQKNIEFGMKNIAKVAHTVTGNDFHTLPMTGSAGGVAYMLKSFFKARLSLGVEYIFNVSSLENKIKRADLVITGEGNFDKQTFMGKAIQGVIKLAKKHKKKVIIVCGSYDKNLQYNKNDIKAVISIKEKKLPLQYSLNNAKELINTAICRNHEIFKNY